MTEFHLSKTLKDRRYYTERQLGIKYRKGKNAGKKCFEKAG
jgi:hypothetical protein